jgi:hypothetical protein
VNDLAYESEILYTIGVKKLPLLSLFLLLIIPHIAYPFEAVGSRVQGMGGTGAALPYEAVTVFYNPAGIYLQDRIAFDFSLGFDELNWPGDWSFSYLKYNRTAQQGAGFGLYRTKNAGMHNGGDAVAALISTVWKTPIGLPLGLSFKYINENWNGGDRQHYFTGDAGVVLPYQSWLVGLSVQSFTQPDSKLYSYQVLAGLSRTFGKITATLQGNFATWDDLKHFDEAEYRFGVELQMSNQMALRGGRIKTGDCEYWTGGIGLYAGGGLGQINLAYHWFPDGEEDDRFFISYDQYLK